MAAPKPAAIASMPSDRWLVPLTSWRMNRSYARFSNWRISCSLRYIARRVAGSISAASWRSRASGFGDDDFLLDAGGAPSVIRRPVRLESEHLTDHESLRVLDRGHSAEYRPFPDAQADAVAVLQSERRFLVGEAEVLRGRPHLHNLGRRGTRLDEADRVVDALAA